MFFVKILRRTFSCFVCFCFISLIDRFPIVNNCLRQKVESHLLDFRNYFFILLLYTFVTVYGHLPDWIESIIYLKGKYTKTGSKSWWKMRKSNEKQKTSRIKLKITSTWMVVIFRVVTKPGDKRSFSHPF